MFGNFSEDMFNDDGFEDFIHILEQDNYKSFSAMFRNLGKNYRVRGTGGNARTRAAKARKAGGGRKGV